MIETPSSSTTKRSHFAFTRALARFVALAIVLGPLTVSATEVDYDHVVNLAGKQSMLLEKMSKEMVLIALDIDKEENLKMINVSHELFDRTLWGLRDGDEGLDLPATTLPEILKALDLVENLWPPFDDAIRAGIQNRDVTRDQLDALAEVDPPLLEAVIQSVKAYVGEATKGKLHSLLAVAIDVNSEQRMLSQKMAKEFFLIAYGHEAERNRERLKQTADRFEFNVNALLKGDLQNRLIPPPNSEIRAQLVTMQNQWKALQPLIQSAIKTGKTNRQSVIKVAKQSLVLLKAANDAVLMYEAL